MLRTRHTVPSGRATVPAVQFLPIPIEGWSLAASVAQFGWPGAVQTRDGETRYYLALTDDDGETFAVGLVQDPEGLRIHSSTELSRAATFQLARMLSIAWPADDAGFPAVGQRDPVVEALQLRYPGVRPIGAPSVLEAAVEGVISLMVPPRIAGIVWRRVRDLLGDWASIDGMDLAAFPGPGRLLDPDALAGIRGMNGERPLIRGKRERIAALARLSLDGELDGPTLRGWDGRLAVEHLQRVAGLGLLEAESVASRGAHHPDVLLSQAPQVAGYIERAYELPAADAEGAAAIAGVWAPYRSWVSALMLCSAQDRR